MEGFGADGDGRLAAGGFPGGGLLLGWLGAVVASQMGFGDALAQVVFADVLPDDGGHAVAVGGVDEVGGGEAALVVVGEVGKCSRTKLSQVGREHDFKNSGWAPRKLAPAAAARLGDRVDGGCELSLMPGRSGEHRTPAVRPASRSLRTAAKRRSGRGARGSSLRASAASAVVMVMWRTRVLLRGDLLEQVDVAGDERGLGDDADAKALLPGEDFEEASA